MPDTKCKHQTNSRSSPSYTDDKTEVAQLALKPRLTLTVYHTVSRLPSPSIPCSWPTGILPWERAERILHPVWHLPTTSCHFLASTVPQSTSATGRLGAWSGGHSLLETHIPVKADRVDFITSRLWVSAQAFLSPVPSRTPDKKKWQERVSWSRSSGLAHLGKGWGFCLFLLLLFKFKKIYQGLMTGNVKPKKKIFWNLQL